MPNKKQINKTKKFIKKNKPQSKLNNIIKTIIVLLFLLVLSIFIYRWHIIKQSPRKSTPNKITKATLGDGLPKQIFAYSGTVKKIDPKQNILILFAPQTENYLLRDKNFKIHLNKQTKFEKIIIPQKINKLKPGQTGSYYQRKKITLKNLKIGDQITAIALENIKHKAEFNAAQIELHNLHK